MMGSIKTENSEEFVVRDEINEYELSRFLRFHPGGRNTISAYQGKNISKAMKQTEHSPSAMYLMNQYIKPCEKSENRIKSSEDIEDLVDWNKAMLWQVGRLGRRYQDWVSSPVDKHLRLFESDLLEYLTVTPWYMIPIVWVPILVFLLICGFKENSSSISQDNLQALWVLPIFGLGFALWSLLEYSIHRWIFHHRPPENSYTLITFHFLLHGLHHKVPFDDQRLLFPPVPALMIASVIYLIFQMFIPKWMLYYVISGTVTGYIIYDLMHFYLHYGSPAADTYLYEMKRYHNHHHFSHHESGFGISSKFWDWIFKTEIFLKKLNIILKW